MPVGSVTVQPEPSALLPFQTVAQYAQLGIWLWDADGSVLLDVDQIESQFAYRRQFRRDFGYVVASAEVMAILAELLQPVGLVLEAGCGSGYLSRELTRLGVPTFAVDCCDFREPRAEGQGYPISAVYQQDALGDASTFVSARFGAILLTWPPYSKPFALHVAQAMLPGQLLVYEGEGVGGCTADKDFFDFMGDVGLWERLPEASSRLNAVHVTLDGLHDRWMVWKRLG